jgi:Tfp pilus assembly protein PilO
MAEDVEKLVAGEESSANRYKIQHEQARELEALGRQLTDIIRRLHSVVKRLSDVKTEFRNGL